MIKLLIFLFIVQYIEGRCTYYGTNYHVGDMFRSIDDCNQCECGDAGVTCTKRPCPRASLNKKRTVVWQRGFRCHYEEQYFNPGDSWAASDGCNNCSCHRGDLVVITRCTENLCNKVPAGHCPYNNKLYKTGESFPSSDKCNTCSCMIDGMVACTDMACLPNLNEIHSVKETKRIPLPYPFKCYYEGQRYAIGDSWTATDGCNTCSCHPGDLIGIRRCTHDACITKVPAGDCKYNGHLYKIGESFPSTDKCNTCSCTTSGLVSCTEMLCLLNTKEQPVLTGSRRSSVYQVGFHCYYEGQLFNVGDTWNATDGCNSCSCHSGKLAVLMTCTEKPCSKANVCTYYGTVYQTGDSFKSNDKCNTCFCGDDGMVICTKRACLHIIEGRSALTCAYNNTMFNVGDRFPSTDGCNTCFCSQRGFVACTEMFCLPVGK